LKTIKQQHIDTVFIESSMFGKLIKRIKKVDSKIKVISYFTDIEADLLNQELRHSNIKRKVIIRKLLHNEYLTVKYADKKFVLNKRDEELYSKIYKNKPNAIIPIIVPTVNVIENGVHTAGEKLKILFVGGDF